MADANVRFGGKMVAMCGLLSGTAIALVLPYMVLTLGQDLGVGIRTTLIIIGIVAGGMVSLVSSFFGLVMPSKVGPQ